MRKILIIILVVTLGISCSQKKMDGIFDLRLGMSEKELREVVNTTLLKEDDTIKRDKKFSKIPGNRFKEFHLDHYVSDNLQMLENIKLSFFDDKLYEIKIGKYSSDIEEMLSKEFGEPKIEKQKNEKPIDKNTIIWMNRKWNTNNKNVGCWGSAAIFPDRSILAYHLIIDDRQVQNWILKQLEDIEKEE